MPPMPGDIFTEVALLLVVAAVLGSIGVRLRQPLIVAFIATGILVGPAALGWVTARDEVDLNIQWAPPKGFLEGLAVRVRYAQVDEKGPMHRQRDDFRVILNYGRER